MCIIYKYLYMCTSVHICMYVINYTTFQNWTDRFHGSHLVQAPPTSSTSSTSSTSRRPSEKEQQAFAEAGRAEPLWRWSYDESWKMKWNLSCMEVIYGNYLWKLAMEVIYGSNLWKLSMDVSYGSYLWTLSMDVIYGS